MTEKKITSRKELRNFGLLFSAVATIVAGLLVYKGNTAWPWPLVLTGFFGISGLFLPVLLRPIHTGWMKFAQALAWLNTRVLLGLFFFLVITPVGLGMRLFGKDLLEQRFDKGSASYWKKRAARPFHAGDYERLF